MASWNWPKYPYIVTDIVWRVFRVLTEIGSAGQRRNVGPGFVIPSIYGYRRMRNRFR